MSDLQPITVYELTDNVFQLIDRDWMLITAGPPGHFNTMTASWGGLGELWNRPVCFCFVRPQRYTFQFMEQYSTFTLTFFDERYRAALNFCGSRSGRDVDKAAATGLTPVPGETGAVYFAEARLILECRKLYAQDLDPAGFLDLTLREQVYPHRDYHRMYVGEILHVWTHPT